MLTTPDVIVSADWLNEHLYNNHIVILDATIPKVTASKQNHLSKKEVIPGSIFFDIKNTFSDSSATFPNTMVTPNTFQNEAQKLGINKDSCVIVYDTHGVYSSPRAWWMFRAMGFTNIAVLTGGLPEWKSSGYAVDDNYAKDKRLGDFKAKPIENSFVDHLFVSDKMVNENYLIIDARSFGRFNGTEPEPRQGVRSGHIPNSKSLPYSSLLNGHKLKTNKEIKTSFNTLVSNNESMLFSCGTGITACVLALGAIMSGYKDISVYDGSWTEWGSLVDLPIEL